MEVKTTYGNKGSVKAKKLIKQIKRHLQGKPMLKNEGYKNRS